MAGQRLLLIVEPLDTLRFQYANHGLAAGLRVEHASDTETALAKASFLNPDVVLTDWSDERAGGGLTLCRRLKGRASTSRIPVLGLISDDDPTAASAAVAVGCTVLAKPCPPERLLAEIVRVLHVRARGTAYAAGQDYLAAIEQLERMLGHVLRDNAQLAQRTADLEASAALWANWYERALRRLNQTVTFTAGASATPRATTKSSA